MFIREEEAVVVSLCCWEELIDVVPLSFSGYILFFEGAIYALIWLEHHTSGHVKKIVK